MSGRITIRHLREKVRILNSVTGNPEEPWANVNGEMVGQIGCYYLSHEFGGTSVHRVLSEGGGVEVIFGHGVYKNAELANLIDAFLEGYRAAKKKKVPRETFLKST